MMATSKTLKKTDEYANKFVAILDWCWLCQDGGGGLTDQLQRDRSARAPSRVVFRACTQYTCTSPNLCVVPHVLCTIYKIVTPNSLKFSLFPCVSAQYEFTSSNVCIVPGKVHVYIVYVRDVYHYICTLYICQYYSLTPACMLNNSRQ